MFPAPFDYHRPFTLQEAVELLSQHGDDARLLAGGHSLLPAMKLRLAQPKVLVDLGRITELRYIVEKSGRILIGAMSTHRDIEQSPLLRELCPLLCEVAASIGDVQVRNCGTLGGSVAHADPAADWPAAMLALDAEFAVVGPRENRAVSAGKFFVDLFQTALQAGEILREIRLPVTPKSVAYVKTAQKASGFALAGVAAVLRSDRKTAAVAVTGVAAKPFRATELERLLNGQTWSAELISRSAKTCAVGAEALNDIHASAEYRLHLAEINAERALNIAYSRG